MIAVLRPAPPKAIARGLPACPAPMTMASKRSGSILFPALQNAPERTGEDIRLRARGDAASIQHLVVSLQLAVELLQIPAENIRSEHQFFERAHAGLRRMRAH